MDDYARILILVGSPLCRDGVLLAAHWSTDVDVAALENGNGITEYEVHSSINVAVAIKLALRVDV